MPEDTSATLPQTADALRYLLFAQEFDPTPTSRYARFVQNLSLKNIPYDYRDRRFVEEVVAFAKEYKEYLADAKISEAKIESSVPNVMVASLVTELENLPKTVKGVKRSRIEEITNAYVKNLRRVVDRVGGEETFKRNLTEELDRLAEETKNPTEFREKIEDALIKKTAEISTDPEKLTEVARPVAHSVVTTASDMLPAILAPIDESEITKALVEGPKRKDLWIKTYIQKAGRDASLNLEDIDRLTATAEAILSVVSGPDLTKSTVFFRTGAKGLQKPFAILADAALTVLPFQKTRDAIIESVLRRGWEVTTQTDKLNKKFGEFLVDSGVFQAAIEKGNQAFGTGEPRSFKGFTNAVSDVATSIFGTPRSTADILALVELGIIKEEYITGWLPAYVAGAHANRSGLFELIFNLGANWGIQRAVSTGGKVAGGALGRWAGTALGSVFGGIFGAIAGFFAGGGLASLFGRNPSEGPKTWWQKLDKSMTGWLLPTLIVGGSLFLIAASSLTINPISLGAAFQQSNYGPTVDCQKDPNNPLCKFENCPTNNCVWPATGTIIQGPFATCDGHTHQVIDAIDILGHYLEPIYSATDGTVIDVGTGCPDDPTKPGCGANGQTNYGNFVDVRAPDGHRLRYAHLSEQFMGFVHQGQTVQKGITILGKMDSSGTVSEHLHFEVLDQVGTGQSIISKYLPVDANFAKQLYKCINASGCNLCPQMQ